MGPKLSELAINFPISQKCRNCINYEIFSLDYQIRRVVKALLKFEFQIKIPACLTNYFPHFTKKYKNRMRNLDIFLRMPN